MVDGITIVLAISSGILGSIIGALLSPYINYKFNIRFLQREIIFKEKVVNYEKIRNCVHSLCKIYERLPFFLLEKEDPRAYLESILENMKKTMIQNKAFDQLSNVYISWNIRLLLEEYKQKIIEYSKMIPSSIKGAEELYLTFNSYSNRILDKINKEIGFKF